MGARCWYCGESFGRCYEHAGDECPPDCGWGKHDCPAVLYDLGDVADEFDVDLTDVTDHHSPP